VVSVVGPGSKSDMVVEDMVGEDVIVVKGSAVATALVVEVVQLDPDIPLPDYARAGDAGADIRASADVTIVPGGGRALVPTGLAIAIPEGYAGFVQPRSGLALRHGVTVLNAPGLIDAGYRNELMVLLVNTDPVQPYEVHRGDRIAQLVIKAVAQARFVAVDELPSSERGLGGFGHSGR
jgi:dUTP pyrophosphatase